MSSRRRHTGLARIVATLSAASLALLAGALPSAAAVATGTISGHVTLPAGHAMDELSVILLTEQGYAGDSAAVAPDGAYRIDGVTPGSYTVAFDSAIESDLYAESSEVTVTAGDTASVDFTARVGATVSGVVTRADGSPAADLAVWADSQPTPDPVLDRFALTDAQGHYAVQGIRPGTYVVSFDSGPSYYPGVSTAGAATTFQLTDGMAVTADQVLPAPTTPVPTSLPTVVGGLVQDVTGTGVPGVTVSLEPVKGGPSIDVAVTGADGSYSSRDSYPALAPGSYRVLFTPPAGSPLGGGWYAGPGFSTTREVASTVTLWTSQQVEHVDVVLRSAPQPARYVAQAPTRVYDSRTDAAGPLRAFELRTIDVAPADVQGMTAAVLNITTTESGCGGYVSALPARPMVPGIGISTTSVSNTQTFDVANMVTVETAPGGLVTLFSICSTHIVVDLEGYYTTSGGAGYVPAATPTRVLDTRTASRPLSAGETRRVDLQGVVPKDAVAAMVTLTTTGATAARTYVSAFPTGRTDGPTTSVVNAMAGADIANAAPVQLAPDGSISVYNNQGTTDVIVDVVGWYTRSGGAAFWATQPWRRASSGDLGPGQTRLVARPGGVGVPANAVAVALNLTTTHPTALASYLVAYPASNERPATSNGNARFGLDVPNGGIVATSDDGYRVYNNAGTVGVLEDVFGYFAPAA
jgi:hypothetical protein